ncbi:MAG: restriction endonuclease [archaeon]
MSKMWMVRAGPDAFLVPEFKKKNIVSIGWDKLSDLSKFKNHEEIKKALREKYPDDKQGRININAGQISRFRFNFKKGDKIVTYDPQERVYLVGEITSDYIYDTKVGTFSHIREVKWLGNVNRDKLSTSTKNTLGAISTIFDLGEDASNEVLAVLGGQEKNLEEPEAEETELDVIKEDIVSKSHEFIKDKILELNWEELQELVAGLLRGMGYKTIVSSKGADRGKDVLASPDGLGLKDPRIIVEVKHRSGQMGTKEVRSFVGVLRHNAKGLYVSTGGFSKEAKYEAERSEKPLTLIDLDMLVRLVMQYYDNFDSDTRTLIPLRKIYWPK